MHIKRIRRESLFHVLAEVSHYIVFEIFDRFHVLFNEHGYGRLGETTRARLVDLRPEELELVIVANLRVQAQSHPNQVDELCLRVAPSAPRIRLKVVIQAQSKHVQLLGYSATDRCRVTS